MGESNLNPLHSSSNIDSKEETSQVIFRFWTGYALAFLSAILFSVGDLCLKLYNGENLKISLLQCILQYIIFLPIISLKKVNLWGTDKNMTILLLVRGLCGAFSMATVVLSIQFLPLGDAIAIAYAYPALVFVFGRIFLKEKCGVLNIVLTIITLIGLVIIAQPSFLFTNMSEAQKDVSESHRVFGILFGVAGAVFVALSIILVRKIGPGIHFSVSLFHYTWEGCIVLIVYLAVTGNLSLPCSNDLPIMVAASTCYVLGQIFTTMALQRERAGPVGLIRTSEVLFSFLLQYFALNVVPSILSAIGAALILSSTIVISIKSICKAMKDSQLQTEK